jgi:hypothetical protein
MSSAACQPSRRSRSTSPNLNARSLRRAHLPLPDIDLVPARGRASDRRADTRAATLRRDASIFRADGSFPSGIGGCHVHLYQAFASSERLSARGALSFRRCLVADATHSIRDAFNDHPSGVGSFPASAFANHPGGSAGHTRAAANCSRDGAEHRCARGHGHGAVAPAGAHGKTGCAGPGDDTAASGNDTNAHGRAGREHRRAAGCNVAVQSARGLADDDYQQSDSSEPGPELRQPVLHPARRHVSRSRTGRLPPGAARPRRFPRPRAGERHRLHGRLRSRTGSRCSDRSAVDPEDRDLSRPGGAALRLAGGGRRGRGHQQSHSLRGAGGRLADPAPGRHHHGRPRSRRRRLVRCRHT